MSHFVFSHVLQEILRYIHLRNTNNVMYNCPSHPRNTHLNKKHVPQCAPQRAFIKIPGPCRQIPWQPAEETSARMMLRNIFPFKNERGPLWLDLLCKSKTILHKSKLKFTWTLREKEKKCRSYVFLKSDNSLKNIHLFFFFYFWCLFKRYLFLFTMLYSNEH